MTQHTDKELELPAPNPAAADVASTENAGLAQTWSHTTSANVATAKQKKSWYKICALLRCIAITPIVKEPIVSREAKTEL